MYICTCDNKEPRVHIHSSLLVISSVVVVLLRHVRHEPQRAHHPTPRAYRAKNPNQYHSVLLVCYATGNWKSPPPQYSSTKKAV